MAGIDRIVTITVGVINQDEALRWYTELLGFEKRADMQGPGMRWLTVSPRKQPELEVVLATWFPEFVGKNLPVVLLTEDCQKTYEELSGKGVVFSQAPQNKPFGLEAVFKDLYGNTYALQQRGKER